MYIPKHLTASLATDMPPTVVYLLSRHPNRMHCVLLRLTLEPACLQKSSTVVIAISYELTVSYRLHVACSLYPFACLKYYFILRERFSVTNYKRTEL